MTSGAFVLLFGWGLLHAWNGLNADGESRQNDSQTDLRESMDTALRAYTAVVVLLFVGGLSMFSDAAQKFIFPAEMTTHPPLAIHIAVVGLSAISISCFCVRCSRLQSAFRFSSGLLPTKVPMSWHNLPATLPLDSIPQKEKHP